MHRPTNHSQKDGPTIKANSAITGAASAYFANRAGLDLDRIRKMITAGG
jgi:hypothetical protein